MVILYYKPSCVFCRQVLATLDRLEIEADRRDITSDRTHESALLEHGGKVQVPYLIDENTGVAMYESDAIVKHLQATYESVPSTLATRPRVHVGGSVCESCEG